jgi:hypothetical protein
MYDTRRLIGIESIYNGKTLSRLKTFLIVSVGRLPSPIEFRITVLRVVKNLAQFCRQALCEKIGLPLSCPAGLR